MPAKTHSSSAGQLRAMAKLSLRLEHWRCPYCLSDCKYPIIRLTGVECRFCAGIQSREIIFSAIACPGGFRWVADLGDPIKDFPV